MHADHSQPTPDTDAQKFREATFPQVKEIITTKLEVLRQLVQRGLWDELPDFLQSTDEELNRTYVHADEHTNIYSNPDVAIVVNIADRQGIFWKKPTNADSIHHVAMNEIATQLADGSMDYTRAAQGVYFLDILTHRYKNANGRDARSMKMLLDNATTTNAVSDDEINTLIGIGEHVTKQIAENTFSFVKYSDGVRLQLGVGYFGLHKGLAYEVVTQELELQNKLPEMGLDILSQQLGVPLETIKEEFIHFMTLDADLSWCKFD